MSKDVLLWTSLVHMLLATFHNIQAVLQGSTSLFITPSNAQLWWRQADHFVDKAALPTNKISSESGGTLRDAEVQHLIINDTPVSAVYLLKVAKYLPVAYKQKINTHPCTHRGREGKE